jgi:hypothetical protein
MDFAEAEPRSVHLSLQDGEEGRWRANSVLGQTEPEIETDDLLLRI